MSVVKRGLLVILILLVAAAGYVLYAYYGTVDLGDRTVSIVIEPGDDFTEVAGRLLERGVVRSRIMLRYPARLRGVDRRLTPGRYDFKGGNSCRSVLDRLAGADFLRVRVTVAEGAPIWKVASILADQAQADSAAVLDLNRDSVFLASLDLPYLEGYLFPETYFFAWGSTTQEMVQDMVAMFRSQCDTIWSDSVHNGLSRDEIVILASIIEAEAGLDEEKPLIASVYHNRLRQGTKLDADPTVIYGLGGLDRPLTTKDLRASTPYNTYRRPGLPPTPINSPGLASLRAALHPDSTDYYYFVADGTGGHRFSRTNREHINARNEIRRSMRQQGGK
ncbi:MAG TPA: endolytic transglycosylase MltG [Acidobacteriota bacterium]|nr:endolytic transglycosylase MltG [Acidobacteriota bacterium]